MNKRPLTSPETEITRVEKIRKMTHEEMKDMLQTVQDTLMKVIVETRDDVKNVAKSQDNIEKSLATLLERTENNEKAIQAMKDEIGELEARLNIREQLDLIDNFRLTGFPPITPTKEEQLELISEILKFVGVTTTKDDFVYWSAYQNRSKSSAVIVGKFASSAKRSEAFKAFREKAKTSEITWNKFVISRPGDPNGLRKINLRTSLTKATMALLNKVREHSTKFKYIWEANGRVLVRKAEGDRAIEIKSSLQLKKIVDQSL